jgi:hypothetical protein
MKLTKSLLVVSISLVLVACGGNSKSSTTPVPVPAPVPVPVPVPSNAQATFNEFWELFDRYYPLMHRKNIDWQQVYDSSSIKITNATTDAEAADLIGEIIARVIKDGHTNASYKDKEFEYQPEFSEGQEHIDSMLTKNTDALVNFDNSSIDNPYISFGTLKADSNIGYIKSKQFEPVADNDTEFTAFKTITDKALKALQNTQGIIVDVRTNGGGQGSFAFYLAGRFATNAPQTVMRQRYKLTTGSTISALSDWVSTEFEGFSDSRSEGGTIASADTELSEFNSSGDFQYANKVAVLTAQGTGSAAEYFTVAMKTQAHISSFGDTTFGIFAGSEMITLDADNNLRVRLSVHDVEMMYQDEFQSFEGIGIQPDKIIYPTAQEVDAGKDVHIDAAVNYINQSTSVVDNCTFTNEDTSQSVNYGFEGVFADHFQESTRWPSQSADIIQGNSVGELTANSTDTSSALEAWKLYNTAMPYDRSWEISLLVNLPLYWNTNGGENAQVGSGLFVGKPVASGISSKVYETNMAVVNGDGRFAQAQLVANRLGDDPIDVQSTDLPDDKESTITAIRFCHVDKTLSYFVDGNKVGESQKIDSTGLDDWNLSAGDTLDVGIMGFAELTTIQGNSPTVDNFTIRMY